MKNRATILNSFFFCLVIFLAACQSGFEVPADVIRVKLGAEPDTLNPITATDAYSGEVNSYIFESLVERDKDTLEFVPKLATSWEIAEDKLAYTFHLRTDVRWQDGTPLTADDVVYSYQLIMNPKTNAPSLKVYYQDIDRVEKVDHDTVRFYYKKVYFMGFAVCGTMTIVPKHIVAKYEDFEASPYSRHPIGLGPYKFKEWVSGQRITLERNENYYGKKPQIREIQFRIIADSDVAFQVLKKGDLDTSSLTPIQWARQTGSKQFNDQFTRFKFPSPGYQYIGWNNNHFAFKDKKVRQAMTMALNREKISQKLSFGLDQLTNGTFFPGSKQYNNAIKPWPYDPERSRILLKEAGWEDHDGDGLIDKDGKAFKFMFMYPSSSTAAERIATILKEELKDLGIHMDIGKLEWAAFLEKLQKREFDAMILGWGSPPEQDPYQIWDISQADVPGSSNHIGFRHQAASDLIRAARLEFDPDKRNALYHQFSAILHEEQPYTFLFNRPELTVVSKRFGNLVPHKMGLDLLEWTVE